MIRNETIALDLIDPPALQPRLAEDDPGIIELATSIQAHGLFNPLTVVAEGDRYRLLAGSRRLRALQRNFAEKAECRVVEVEGDVGDQITIAENLFRKNLSPVEEAMAFALYIERTGCSHDELAGKLGMERTYVTRRLLLLDLDDTTLGALEEGMINLSQAIVLRRIDDPEVRAKFVEHSQQYGSNVRVMGIWVDNYEKEQARAVREGNRPLEAATFQPPREVFMACDRCGTPTSYDTLRPSYLCPVCRQQQAAFRAAKGE